MKKGVLICTLFLFAAHHLKAQKKSTSWDSTYRPASYKLKVGLFKSYPNDTSDIIFLGNSITAGVDWMELLSLPQARNRGISGDITFGVLERLSEVTEGKPSVVFILIGINDISRNIPDSLIARNYRTIIDRIRTESPNTTIYVQTLLPVNNSFSKYKNHYNKDEHIKTVNEALKKICATKSVHLIDIHDHFLDDEGKLIRDYTEDGLHLNAKGYAAWKKLLDPYIISKPAVANIHS